VVLDYSLLTATFISAALSATSVGVTVGIWQGAGNLNTPHGQLLIDVAELDDLSSIVLMAVLVAMVPVLVSGAGLEWTLFGFTFLQVLFTLAVFAITCWGFSVFVEQRLTQYVLGHSTGYEPMVMIMAIAFIVAALAEMFGLSLAIGAFLAGLAFSRDTEAAKEHVVFQGLHDFFTPFFFIGLGLQIPLDAFFTALGPGVVLVVAAIAGKLLGAGLPVWSRMGFQVALLIGVSMVPRAEIAMVVMQKGMEFGVVPEAFAAMLIVSAITIILTALVLPFLLKIEIKSPA